MSVKFHAMPPSANSACTRCVLACAGIEHEEVNAYGQTRTPEYIAKFPTNLAPAIEHGDVYVSETNAVARYLCNAFPEKAGKFYPGDLKSRAQIDMIAEYSGISIYSLIAKAMYADVGFGGSAGDIAAIESLKESIPISQKAAAEELLRLLNDKYVNGWLKDSTFLCGEEPTIADFRFGPILLFARVAIVLPERIAKYLDDLETKVPGYKEATEGPRGFTADKVKA
jgi:glutathione S-transferase